MEQALAKIGNDARSFYEYKLTMLAGLRNCAGNGLDRHDVRFVDVMLHFHVDLAVSVAFGESFELVHSTLSPPETRLFIACLEATHVGQLMRMDLRQRGVDADGKTHVGTRIRIPFEQDGVYQLIRENSGPPP